VSRALWVTSSVIFASLLLYLAFVGHREQVARMTSALPNVLNGLTRLVEQISLPAKNQATGGGEDAQAGKPRPKTSEKTATTKPPQAPDQMPDIVLTNVTYNADGKLVLTGRSQPEADLEFFIDGVEIEQPRLNADGGWKLVVPDAVRAGPHKLEVSVAAQAQRARTIVVLPFVKAGAEEIAALARAEKPVAAPSKPPSKLAELARSQSVKNDVDPMAGLIPRLMIGEGPELVMPQTDREKAQAPNLEITPETGKQQALKPALNEPNNQLVPGAPVLGAGKQRQKVKTNLVAGKDARVKKPAPDETALSKAVKKAPYTGYRKVTVAAGQGLVVVQPGNTLWDLAISIYGSGSYYQKLYRANRYSIKNPQMIFPGQIIFAPGANPPASIEPLSPPQWLPPQ